MSDHLFRLGWLTCEPVVALTLARDLAGKAEAYRNLSIGEASTIAIFVEPILRGLSWDTLDIDQVGSESRRPEQVGDIHLYTGSRDDTWSLRALLQVKDVACKNRDLENGKFIDELEKNVNERLMHGCDTHNVKVRPTPVDGWLLRGVITNGRLWLLYDFLVGPGGNRREHLGRFELSESLDQQGVADFTNFLSRDAILRRLRG